MLGGASALVAWKSLLVARGPKAVLQVDLNQKVMQKRLAKIRGGIVPSQLRQGMRNALGPGDDAATVSNYLHRLAQNTPDRDSLSPPVAPGPTRPGGVLFGPHSLPL